MKQIASVAILVTASACSGDVATTYDDQDYPAESTAVIGPSPDNDGKVVITAVGGRRLQCGDWPTSTACQRARLLPGTTIVRLDYLPSVAGRLLPARDLDLHVAARSGHTYHIVANVVRDDAGGEGGTRVTLHIVDKGLDQPLPPLKP